VTTSPDIGAFFGQSASTAAAIAPPALPPPSTSVRPFGGLGRNAAVSGPGTAFATAASNSASKNPRGSV